MPIQILQYGVKVRDPVTKQFNDLAALKGEPGGGTADALPLAGGTMSGNINMDSNKVTNLPTPTANGDAVPKSYTDSIVAISDTQPTATENKLWVDTDAGAGSSYQVPTVAEMEAADAQTAAEIGIVITGKRPSMAVTAGQFVIVRNSTISGISDGLYTANAALSPSTDVTASNLTAVSNGGLNDLKAKQPRLENTVGSSTTIPALTSQVIRLPVASVPGYKASGVMGVVGTGNCVIAVFLVDYINQEVVCRLYNPTDTASTFTPIFVCLYLAE